MFSEKYLSKNVFLKINAERQITTLLQSEYIISINQKEA